MPTNNGPLDVKRLIGEVASKHGILLKPDDAAFALVTMNRSILEEIAEQICDRIGVRLAEFEASAVKLERRAGKILAQDVKESSEQIRAEMQRDIDAASLRATEIVRRVEKANSRPSIFRWAALGIASALAMFGSGLWIGARYLHI